MAYLNLVCPLLLLCCSLSFTSISSIYYFQKSALDRSQLLQDHLSSSLTAISSPYKEKMDSVPVHGNIVSLLQTYLDTFFRLEVRILFLLDFY